MTINNLIDTPHCLETAGLDMGDMCSLCVDLPVYEKLILPYIAWFWSEFIACTGWFKKTCIEIRRQIIPYWNEIVN